MRNILVTLKTGLLLLSPLITYPSWAVEPAATTVPQAERCKPQGNNPFDGPRAFDVYEGQIASSVIFADKSRGADWINRMVTEWDSPTCLLDDGRPLLAVLIPGYAEAFKMEPDWSKSANRVKIIKDSFPNAPFAALLEASYWVNYAWNARGYGYAQSVAPDAWKLFKERLTKAEQILNDSKSYADALPAWYELMIKVQSGLGRPAGDRDKTFLEGTKKFKTYLPTYFIMMTFLLPQWGEDWNTVDNFISWSVENTQSAFGTAMYARLYWAASQGAPEGTKFFTDTRVSWPKMKKGFEDLMKLYPRSKWNLNNFAKFACMADDKKTFLSLRKQIGSDVMSEAWARGVSLDLCNQKYGYTK